MNLLLQDVGLDLLLNVAATSIAAQSAPGAMPASQEHWYDKIINDPVNITSISLAILAIIIGIIPLILWNSDRKKYKILEATLSNFSLVEETRKLREKEVKAQALTQAETHKIEAQARKMRDDVEKAIPNAAMVAYYENTIPQIELEMLDLKKRATAMRASLEKLKASAVLVSPEVQSLLSEEISKNLGGRRRLEQDQVFLIVLTSLSSVIITLIPDAFTVFAGFVIAIITFIVCVRLLVSARSAYPDNRLLSSRFLSPNLIIIIGIIILSLIFIIRLNFRFYNQF